MKQRASLGVRGARTPVLVAVLALVGPAACGGAGGPEGGEAEAAMASAGETQEPAAPEVEYLTSDATRSLELPFSEAVRVGDLLFLSGQVGNVPGERRVVEGGIGPETRQTLENIRATLERFGSSLDRVVKCTAMLADMGEWGAMNEVYTTFFAAGRRPARSAFGASGLALGARVEIECLAAVG